MNTSNTLLNTLLNTPVCIAIDHKYSDNNGAWTVFYFWNGQEVISKGGMYEDYAFNAFEVNATIDQKRAASIWTENNTEESLNYCNKLQADTYVDCIVKLKRSRKAPNNIELKVVDFAKGGYNAYNNYTPDQVRVVNSDNTIDVWVSASCINEVIKGAKVLPWWHVSQAEANKINSKATKIKRVANRIEELKNLVAAYYDANKDKLAKDLEGITDLSLVSKIVSGYMKPVAPANKLLTKLEKLGAELDL